ncbi:hypothetical protein ACRAWD_03525 [Caulobacter segnis]
MSTSNYNSYLYQPGLSVPERRRQPLRPGPADLGVHHTTEGLTQRNRNARRGRLPGWPALRQRRAAGFQLHLDGRRRTPPVRDLHPGRRGRSGRRPTTSISEVRPFVRESRPGAGQPLGGHDSARRPDLGRDPHGGLAADGRDQRPSLSSPANWVLLN